MPDAAHRFPRARGLFHPRTIGLLLPALASLLLGACTASPTLRTHPELPQRKAALQRVGLIPALVTVFEEQARYRTIPHPEWSAEAAQRLTEAFVAEAAARQLPLLLLEGAAEETAAVADLFAPLEMSIRAHAYQKGLGYIGDEPFPGGERPFSYSLGSLEELLGPAQLDAVWLISATNLLPTPAAQLGDAGQVALSFVSAFGMHPVPALILDKLQLRVALFERSGTLLFYDIIEQVVPPPSAGQGALPAPAGEDGTGDYATTRIDLRDPLFARACVKAIFAEYRRGVAP